MDKRVEQLNSRKKSIVSISKKLQWVFFVILALYILGILGIVIYSIALPSEFVFIGPDSVISLIPVALNAIACGFVLLILGFVFREIGKGASPFTVHIANCLNVLGAILLIAFISGILIQPGTEVGAVSDSAAMTIDYDSNSSDLINLDIKSLLASVVSFALSAVFRYGAILQSEADDLV